MKGKYEVLKKVTTKLAELERKSAREMALMNAIDIVDNYYKDKLATELIELEHNQALTYADYLTEKYFNALVTLYHENAVFNKANVEEFLDEFCEDAKCRIESNLGFYVKYLIRFRDIFDAEIDLYQVVEMKRTLHELSKEDLDCRIIEIRKRLDTYRYEYLEVLLKKAFNLCKNRFSFFENGFLNKKILENINLEITDLKPGATGEVNIDQEEQTLTIGIDESLFFENNLNPSMRTKYKQKQKNQEIIDVLVHELVHIYTFFKYTIQSGIHFLTDSCMINMIHLAYANHFCHIKSGYETYKHFEESETFQMIREFSAEEIEKYTDTLVEAIEDRMSYYINNTETVWIRETNEVYDIKIRYHFEGDTVRYEHEYHIDFVHDNTIYLSIYLPTIFDLKDIINASKIRSVRDYLFDYPCEEFRKLVEAEEEALATN